MRRGETPARKFASPKVTQPAAKVTPVRVAPMRTEPLGAVARRYGACSRRTGPMNASYHQLPVTSIVPRKAAR